MVTTPSDPGCATGCGGGTTTTAHIPVGDGPNFSATKVADKATYIVGEPITYTIIETNSGAGAGSATVTDTVPGIVTVNSVGCVTSVATDSCVAGPQTNNVAGSVTLSAGATATFTITGVTNATGDAQNSVVTTPSDPGCATGCGGGTTTTAHIPVGDGPNFSATKVADKATYIVGEPITYTIIETNSGAGAGSATVTDTVPGIVTVNSVGCVTSVATDSCVAGPRDQQRGRLGHPLGGGHGHLHHHRGDQRQRVTQNSVVTTPSDPGCATGCGGGTATAAHIPVGDGPNFSATKVADKATYIVGEPINYTIVVTNSGTGSGSATVTDTVPGIVTVNSVGCVTTVATDSCVASSQTNNVAGSVTLSAGATATFTITGVTNATGDAKNTEVVTPTTPGCETQ